MTRHARHFTLDLLAAVCFVSSVSISALAADGPPPNFAPHANAGWFAFSRTFIAPASGPGPVRPHPAYPHVSNDEYRLTGRQPTIAMGDPGSPILQPWASEVVRKRNEYILAGNPPLSRHASCWPMGIPAFLLMPMTRPMYIIQGPKQVVMILTSFNEARRIHLADKHSDNVKTSWHGESIGRYDGDTLVVDTIGLDDRSSVDGFGTPHTKQLHVIERFRLTDGSKTLEANVHVEDPGAFTMPWSAIQRYRLFEAVVAKVPVEKIPMLSTPAEGPLTEAICAENPNSFFPGQSALPIPQAAVPDF